MSVEDFQLLGVILISAGAMITATKCKDDRKFDFVLITWLLTVFLFLVLSTSLLNFVM